MVDFTIISIIAAEFIILVTIAIFFFYIYRKHLVQAEIETLKTYENYMKDLASLTKARKVLDLFVTQIISHEKLSNSAFTIICDDKKMLQKIGFNMEKGSLDSITLHPSLQKHFLQHQKPFFIKNHSIHEMGLECETEDILVAPFRFEDHNRGFVFFFIKNYIDEQHRSLINVYASQTALKLKELTLEEASETYEKSLGRIEQSFVRVLENSPSGLLILNASMDVVYANKSVRTMFNLSTKDRKIQDFVSQNESAKALEEMLEKLFNGSSKLQTKEKFLIPLSAEQSKVFDIFAYPIHSVEKIVHVVLLLRDRTKQYHLEKELRLTQELATKELKEKVEIATAELVAANSELRKANSLKSEFVSTISHELRTPLTSIKGYISLLHSKKLGDLNKQQSDSLRIVKEEADRLGELINDILDFSRLESGKTVLNVQPTSPEKLIHSVIESFTLECEKKNISCELKKKDAPEVVPLDESKFKQIIVNLLSNAVKFSPEKSTITFTLTQNDHYGIIQISDEGKGISKDKISQIFNPFYQIQEHQTEEIKGTGLGLAIVKNIMDLHKGTIDVQSQVGKGTTFTLSFPLE
ncbi:MAG: sensor histidine kinase [Candidatus Woesearchaeota archaeon]